MPGADRKRHAYTALAVVTVVAVAAIYVWQTFWLRALHGVATANHDTYTYFYPNMEYALRTLRSGAGILWNPLQHCGQPSLAVPTMALFYPLNAIFLVADIDRAMFLILVLHLSVAGIGCYALCRELGCRTSSALAGAFAFQLGAITILLAGWTPTIIGPYAWLPAALASCERALRARRTASWLTLGVLLTLQLLPGYPQISFFTYQLILLRTVWELLTRRPAAPWRLICGVAFGLSLPLFLAAAQLVPSVEFISESIRGASLSSHDIRAGGRRLEWWPFTERLLNRWAIGKGFSFILLLFTGLAVTMRRHRRMAGFFAIVACLYVALAFDTPLQRLYLALPFGSSFRLPNRFLWISCFAVCVLAALGVDSLIAKGASPRSRLVAVVAWALLLGGIYLTTPTGIRNWEWALLAATLVAGAMAMAPQSRPLAGILCASLILVSVLAPGPISGFGPLRDGNALRARAPVLNWLKRHMTPQDRILQIGKRPGLSLIPKTSTLFEIPSITDYEPQASSRYAHLFVRLLTDRPMMFINQFYIRPSLVPSNRPLLNLVATRYIVCEEDLEPLRDTPPDDLILRREEDDIRIYENTDAMPRASYVPTAEVVKRPGVLLNRLASAEHDPRKVVLLDEFPTDRFLGEEEPGEGEATIVVDQPEHLKLRIRAERSGFAVLTDQHYPGWKATLNGTSVPIMRANYAFRAVRVPAGVSTLEFHYRPRSVGLGLLVSAVSWAAVFGFAGLTTARRWFGRATQSPT